MATSLEITNSILSSINTALQNPDLSVDDRSTIINQYEQITDMIREGYQFSDSDLLSLPTLVKDEVLSLLLNSRNTKDLTIGVGKVHDPLLLHFAVTDKCLHLKTNVSISSSGQHLYFNFSGCSYSSSLVEPYNSSFYLYFGEGLVPRFRASNMGDGLVNYYISQDGFLCLTFLTSYIPSYSVYEIKLVEFMRSLQTLFSVQEYSFSPDASSIY